ncbi:hypothetical protein [Staphylococcus intermedius]|uniref:Hypothetical phage membrane protein n=1 Tax=Staphylococcus intermedius NCTC 11048 TaxID=1141106 RepID=A0A380G9W1_STAIN|nr:hypothetical protein [Staphylococcus intermedius]PCF89235.1 hypothetical protein B4W76_03040 [Staphylococcus intermedius]PNZ52214.1 hypothetical protein CD138_06815 [Staphylococcus intermedius NCTC 11048]SUM47038.1 hypothetical phage membrane protein [Staphylococcus intermedius NCTC 11048]
MKKQTFSETIAFVLIFGLGAFTFVRALFWSYEQNEVINDSEFYTKLNEVMPIWLWGVLLMIASLILMLSVFFLPKQPYNNVCNYLLLFGGFSTAIMYFLMTSASIFNAINWLTWAQFAVLTVVCGAIGFLGGAAIYERRK